MNIGQAAMASGVSAKLIRYYEAIGLIPPAERSRAGYRTYALNDVHVLRFIKRARGLGLSIPRIRLLVSLWRNKRRSSAEVKRLALAHVTELEEKIRGLQAMSDTLRLLAERCSGDHRPDCPILDDLDGMAPPVAEPMSRSQVRGR